MRVILEAIAGPHLTKRIVMPGYEKGTFGRTEWSDYQFPNDPLMSSKHFSIECVGATCVVRDLGSTNGTYVNEQRVVEGTVVTGSIIRAGQTSVKVTLEEGLATPRPVVPRPPATPPQPVVATALDMGQVPEEPRLSQRIAPRDEAKSALGTHQKALADDDPLVRRNALLAATWAGQRWVLDHCRGLCAPPLDDNWDALLLLAILGEPADIGRILAIGRAADLGSKRFQVVGAYGHPEIVNDLIVGIENADPAIAVAAANAFTRITGVDISSPTDSQPDLTAAALPNADVAASEWRKLKGKFSAGERWVGGLEVSRGLPAESADKIDLEARFEACLRGRFQRKWQASRFDLEQLADALAK